MKTASVRDLRYDFPKVEAWLKAGEEVRITKRNKVIGRLVADKGEKASTGKAPLPDYAARRKRIFGDRVQTKAEGEADRAWETGEP
jgi:antitoxin (DNA-binding transcriptional repressor) of toxin-antitoxin stability system